MMLSVVVVVHNIVREAPRTLLSLSAGYQQDIDKNDYEVIVVDNGSTPPLDPSITAGLSGNFRFVTIADAVPSPARAINRGLAEARGDVIGVMIDGARMATPGLLHLARHAATLYDKTVVSTPGWYLGPDYQRRSMLRGYDRAREDALLQSIAWPADGYRLFEIGTVDESSGDGRVLPIAESNALFLRREFWNQLHGFDERFDAPGGGLVNLDTFKRAVESPGARLVVLFGEATFHQLHGGVATNAPIAQQRRNWDVWAAQYETIRRVPFAVARPLRSPIYMGPLRRRALAGVGRRVLRGTRQIAAARAWPLRQWLPRRLRLRAHIQLASLWRALGKPAAALRHARSAVALNRDSIEAYLTLAAVEMPGDDYVAWLGRLYGRRLPATAMEIGVYRGRTLALLQPPTAAVGIDPAPMIDVPLPSTTTVVRETSDEFFDSGRALAMLDGRPLDTAFIDGLHQYEQALRDFIHVEALSGPRSMVLIHDTVPPDEPSQRRLPQSRFHTGDVWRLVLCLKHFRPDLDVFTIATAPTGLTVVTGLDPASRLLQDRYDEAVAYGLDIPYEDMAANKAQALGVVPNDWDSVRRRLEQRHIV